MTAHHYRIRTRNGLAYVLAFTRAHALRLLLEGAECIRGVDGKAERCGIIGDWRTT